MVTGSDLKVYKSTNLLGGPITVNLIQSASPNNCFTNVTKAESTAGEDFYKCVYFKNTHATEKMDNFKIWLSSKSFPHDTEVKWAFDLSSTAQTIPDKYTAPTSVTWHELESEPSEINVGDFLAGTAFPIWIWYHVEPGAESRADDNEIFSYEFNIPQGGTGSTGGGDTGGTGGNPPPASTDYKIAVAGDWGCENETDDVISLIKNGGYDILIGVGDNAYESPTCWINRFNTIKSKFIGSAYGNHEYEESGGTGPYKTFFADNTTYYTLKYQNILFAFFDSNINFDSGSAQYTSMRSRIDAAATDNTITWRIAVVHHPLFGADSNHSYNDNNFNQTWQTYLQTKKFSIIMTGHNHNWQRTKQVVYNSGNPESPTVVDATSPFSRSTVGMVHVVSGTGGHDSGSSLYSLGSQPGFQGYQNRTHNGIWEIVASSNAQTLTCSFVETGGDKFDTIVFNA
jgi:predicted phosphodiesterase